MEIPHKRGSAPIKWIARRWASIDARFWLTELGWQLAVPLAFFLVVFLFFPYSSQFEFSTDEGNNLMMSMLVERGHSLYAEIWNDQPPLFTYLLSATFHFFDAKVGVARLLVLLTSVVLVWSFFQFTRLVWGNWVALAGAFTLFILPKYMTLSVSVMVGIPALALAMLALLFLGYWHSRRESIWLVLSGAALALSILTKLFTGILAPVFLIGLLAAEINQLPVDRSWRKTLTPALLWGLSFTLVAAALSYAMVGPENLAQLLQPHLNAAQIKDFQVNESLTIQYHLKDAIPVLFLAATGSLLALRARRWLFLYPLAWMVVAYLFLFQLSPVWVHHQLLVTVPAAMLGGIAVYEALSLGLHILREHFDPSWSGSLRAAAILGFLALLFTFRTPESLSLLRPTPSLTNSEFEMGPLPEKFFVKMLKFAPETHWVVTDMPMYAFRAHLPVPPNLAVISAKRLVTGELPEEEILATIREYDPDQVLLGRFEFPAVEAYLRPNYRLVLSNDNTNLYVRRDLGS